MAIEFENVSYHPQDVPVFGPASFSASEKRIGIVGQNGSGKSSFARLLAGLLKPDSGSIAIDGVDVYADRKAALATIGIIFQNPDHQIIFPTVGEELAFGLQQQGMMRKRAADKAKLVLSLHGRPDWFDKSTQTLSQGQRHFLCLLSVLAMEPKTIILDEPYAGLDIPTSIHLHAWLARLEQQIILITHDPKALTDFDRVIWLENGQIKQDGPAAATLADFTAEMTQIGERNAGADLPT
ncbi:MAG: cobalt ABC transporter [Rhodobacteraceae bacterium]|nr:MAG: cobalt ABC transporter [Paracoccaceae bacterium]